MIAKDYVFPNVGEGPLDVRLDAARFNATFHPNCVTRSVCRDIWRDAILQNQKPGAMTLERMHYQLQDLATKITRLEAAIRKEKTNVDDQPA